MSRPNLFVVGAAKSGTSTLHTLLGQHPQIWMSDPKEPHWFSHRWPDGEADYTALFAPGAHLAFRGESSTGYAVFPDVPERIVAFAPEAHILLSLRNPIDRAWSHYWWLRLQGQESRDFDAAFEASLERPSHIEDRISGTGNYANYHHAGCYGRIVARYVDVFGPEAVWLTRFGALVSEPQATLDRATDFLGLPSHTATAVHSNPTSAVRFPRLARAISRLGSRRLAKALPGARTAKKRLLSVLRARGPAADYPRPDSDVRAALASVYEPEVARLRGLWPDAQSWWTDDFPVPGAP